jgi:hypothetical protein
MPSKVALFAGTVNGLSVGHLNGFYEDLAGRFFAIKVSHGLKTLSCLSPATPANKIKDLATYHSQDFGFSKKNKQVE